MRAIPSDLVPRFDELLTRSGIEPHRQPHYRRWLRFYLDFCAKYGQPALERGSVRAFLHKLEEKKQAEWMRAQALDAVRLYFVLFGADRTPSNAARTEQAGAAHSPAGAAGAGPTRPSGDAQRRVAAAPDRPGIAGAPARVCATSPRRPHPNGQAPEPEPLAPRCAPAADSDPAVPRLSVGTPSAPARWPDLYRRLTEEIQLRHYSKKTLKSYTSWARKLQGFVRNQPPAELSVDQVKAFLTHLAVDKQVSASSQNQAFNALLFVFRHVLGREFGKVDGVVRAKKRPYVPVVLSRDEVDRMIARLAPPFDLPAKLLYGCGLRLFECLKLRVQDVDLALGMLTVHDGKGQKDRTLPLPKVLMPALREQHARVAALHRADLAAGYAGTFLPNRYEQRAKSAARDLAWQWFFPAAKLTAIPGTSERRRYHLHETALQKALKVAVQEAGIPKRASAHTLRHSYASHLLQANYDIRTIQQLLGHGSVKTTMIYTHTVPSVTAKEARSPLDL